MVSQFPVIGRVIKNWVLPCIRSVSLLKGGLLDQTQVQRIKIGGWSADINMGFVDVYECMVGTKAYC